MKTYFKNLALGLHVVSGTRSTFQSHNRATAMYTSADGIHPARSGSSAPHWSTPVSHLKFRFLKRHAIVFGANVPTDNSGPRYRGTHG